MSDEDLKYTQKDFDRLIENIGNKPQTAEVTQQKTEDQQFKDWQLANLTLKMTMDRKNLYSLSCITEEERNDFANARSINAHIFGEPMYDTYEGFFFETSRSVTSNKERQPFYQGLFDMVKTSFIQPGVSAGSGIVSKLLGR